jgi:DNA-binding transcriptional ArsR family regulator
MTEELDAQGAVQEPGYQDKPDLRSSDPALLRALAHPLRVEILAVIDELGEATATQIAERVGESPSNCSFHLRTLAKAGFIERATAQGTSKPWRSVHRSRDLRPDPKVPESLRTSATIAALYVQHEANRMVDFLTKHGVGHEEWVEAVTVNASHFWATADELAQLSADVAKLSEKFHDRKDPAKRPPGSRRATLFSTLNPDLEGPAWGEQPDGATGH